MSDIEFQVVNARPGTENQRKFGIMATFGLNIIVDGEVLFGVADWKLAKSREGQTYIASPHREYESQKDGKKMKIYFAKIFPKDEDKKNEACNAIIEQVKRECDNVSNRPSNTQAPAPNNSNTRSSNPPKTYNKPPANKDGW